MSTATKVGSTQDPVIVYVLGCPGSGKSTQCSRISALYGFSYMSTGELLDKEVKSGSENGELILSYKKEGKLLPTEIVMKLIQQEMEKSPVKKFLIDGFPRNEENLKAAENIMKIEPNLVLVFEVSTEVAAKRILGRNQGRVDDNPESVAKRLKVYNEATLPIIEYYNAKGKALKINAERPVEEVFEDVKKHFSKFEWAKVAAE